jgi:3-deoxy-D-manno-octulosonic acid (KDO) 8-phosphate synthase
MLQNTNPAPSRGTCFIDAQHAHLHKAIPSLLKAPLHGLNSWRIGTHPSAHTFLERRGWVQPIGNTVTTPEQIEEESHSYERLYIPGEFCRQGDVLNAAAQSGKTILLERGAFLAPSDILRAVEKLGPARDKLILVEAGSSFGYSDRVLDPRSLHVMANLGIPLALNLNALAAPVGVSYQHRPAWLSDTDFDLAFIQTALAFNTDYIILPTHRELSPKALALWIESCKESL